MILMILMIADDLEYLRWVGWAHCDAVSETSSRARVWVLVVMMIVKLVIIMMSCHDMIMSGDEYFYPHHHRHCHNYTALEWDW